MEPLLRAALRKNRMGAKIAMKESKTTEIEIEINGHKVQVPTPLKLSMHLSGI